MAQAFDLSEHSANNCGSAWSQTFSYDAFGNITKTGTSAWMPTYNSPVNNQYLNGWNKVSYDANGNLLNDTFNTYSWDVYGGLASVNGASVTNDAFGRMVENQGRGFEIVYSPSGAVLAAMQGQTLNMAYVPLPGITAAYLSSGLSTYLDPDWQGSVRLLTVYNRTALPMPAYAPFGEGYAGGTPLNSEFTAGGYSFTVLDGENDSGTLDDFMFRRYSPSQGRWISPDPAGLAAANPASPQSWNRYAYVLNNPLSYVDPLWLQLGHCQWEDGTSDDDEDSSTGESPCGAAGGTWVNEVVGTSITVDGGDSGTGGDGGGLSNPPYAPPSPVGGGAAAGAPSNGTPWYKSCTAQALLKGAGTTALDAIGILPEGGTVSAAFSLFHGAAGVSNGIKIQQRVAFAAGIVSTAAAGSDLQGPQESTLSTTVTGLQATVDGFGIAKGLIEDIPVAGQAIAIGATALDLVSTGLEVAKCY